MTARVSFAELDDLITRIVQVEPERPIVFLVGSALTMPARGAKGVANVGGVIEIVREMIREDDSRAGLFSFNRNRAREKLERDLEELDDAGLKYQRAFAGLKSQIGPEAVNKAIRRAVLEARAWPSAVDVGDAAALAALESAPAGWALGPAVKALGLLLARHGARFERLVLTTNFDPLIEVAVRAAGGQALAAELSADGLLPTPDPSVTTVVHVHGLWRSDTLHTPGALTDPRPALVDSIARVFERATVVVLGYGGWDDVFTRALLELARDREARPDVLWCFYERSRDKVASKYAKVIDALGQLGERSVAYLGVDCHELLPRIRELMDGESPLLGREPVVDALGRAAEPRAIELLGEAQMGRSRVLEYIAECAREAGKPVAYVRGREAEADPVKLVRQISRQLDCEAEVLRELRRIHAKPDVDDAGRALVHFRDAWILVDDAEALAQPGHGFNENFFHIIRSMVEAGELRWVSVCARPLGPRFEVQHLSSTFLNHSTKIHVGGLERREVEIALRARMGPDADEALALTGTLPALVLRLCEYEFEGARERLKELPGWAAPLFAQWLERPADERALLRRALLDGVARKELGEGEQRAAQELVERGLLCVEGERFVLNGGAWADYVRAHA